MIRGAFWYTHARLFRYLISYFRVVTSGLGEDIRAYIQNATYIF